MATTHRILDDLYEESYSLFAIHSSLDDFALVYTLNQYLKTRFRRLRKDLDIALGLSFPIFEWRDEINDRYWTLIANVCHKEEIGKSNDLFMDESAYTTYHLLPELRELDYVVKIEGELTEEEESLLKSVANIPKIIAAYALDANRIKSKKNLIF